ncbi:MAG: hypothetical protein RR338_05480 [Clostridia bacterium]
MKKVILSLIVAIIAVMASTTLASFSVESSIVSGGIISGENKNWDIDGFYTMTKNIEVVKGQKYTLDFVFDGGKPNTDYSLYFDVFYNSTPYDGKTRVPLDAKLIKTDKDGKPTAKQGVPIYKDRNYKNGPTKLHFDEGKTNYYRLEIKFADTNQIIPTIYNDVKINVQGVDQNLDADAASKSSDINYLVNYAKQLLDAMTEAERKAFGYGYINNEMIRNQVKRLNYDTFPKVYTKDDSFYIQPYVPQVTLADGTKLLDCSQTIIFGKSDQNDGWYTKYLYDIESTTWYYQTNGMSIAGKTWNDIKTILRENGSKWTPVNL